jgi:hypothetical protein
MQLQLRKGTAVKFSFFLLERAYEVRCMKRGWGGVGCAVGRRRRRRSPTVW